ncbi:chloride channel protein [Hymenobacter gummosus]|uniref:Chloride channel protein n=1 Tax=Hymenobacter gummosus TaxID=1776032 RepID=A0A3S0H6X3_9BACT|nr:chloride channel protein [Hymenobacter gummosus]RTQ51604.1 chloride channel protein [Hymenobacter gummosus]
MNILLLLRRQLHTAYDSLDHFRFKRDLLNALPFWTGAFITGLVAVLYAKIFAWAEQGTAYIYHHARWSFLLVTPLCFLLGWWLVVRFAPFARGSGIPQVSAAIDLSSPRHHYRVDQLLSLRVLVVKVLSSTLLIFGGGVTGREGPTIQIAASVFRKINSLLPAWYPKVSRRNMVVTGAAAGLAAAFNTPLGGIVFAIEELTRTHFTYFKSALLTGVIIAGLTALNLLGPYLYLGAPLLTGLPVWIVFVVLLVALLTGVAGSGMAEIILWVMRRKARIQSQVGRLLVPVACGLAVALLSVLIDERAFGSGKEIMVSTLFGADKHVSWSVPLLRFVGPILTFSAGAAGGIFAPSLTAGASIGSALSGLMYLSPTETNLIVLCGMTGFLTAVTRSPFTSSILVIEMTNTHNVIFYLMLAALFANLVSNLVNRHSFYDQLKHQYIREIHQSEAQEGAAAVEKQRKGEDDTRTSS